MRKRASWRAPLAGSLAALGNAAIESFYLLLYLISGPAGFFMQLRAVKPAGCCCLPIVLLHGWATQNPILALLKWRLEQSGFQVYVPSLGLHFTAIEMLTRRLHEYIAREGISEFICIGHSLGGIIALAYHHAHPEAVRSCITLGTPFHGRAHGWIFDFSASARQMRPGSSFLRGLHLCKPSPGLVFSLASENDEVVLLASTSLPGARHIRLTARGHVDLVLSARVFRRIRAVLDEGGPPGPRNETRT